MSELTAQLSLFGPVASLETRREAERRAKRIAALLNTLASLPEDIDCMEGNMGDVDRFLAHDGRYEENWWDGLNRFLCLDEVASDEELTALRTDPAAWIPADPRFLGSQSGDMIRAKLTASERGCLEAAKHLASLELDAMRALEGTARAELGTLRAVGPLPNDIANKCRLTPDGEAVPA